MVTTRTGDHSAAPSKKSRSKNVHCVDIQPQPKACGPTTEDDAISKSSMQLHQDSASLVHDGDCPLAATDSRLCACSLPHEIPEPANPDLQMSAYFDTLESSVHSFQEPANSGPGESFVHNAQEPVESGLKESSNSQQTLNVDFPYKAETAEPTPLQGTQTTEPRSQESDTGFAKSAPEESWNTTNSTREGMHASLISRGINTAGAAPQEGELTDRNRGMQPTDLAPPQGPKIADLSSRESETAGSDGPQETEIADPAGCQDPEAASLAPHETAPQDPETADRIRHREPEIADVNHRDITNVNRLTIADLPLQKPPTANVEPRKAETADIDPPETAEVDPLGTKTTDPVPLPEPQITNVDPREITDVNPPKTADPPLQEPQTAHSVPQDNRCSNSEEASHPRALSHLASDGNSRHSHTDTSAALFGCLGDTNENPIILDNSTAGDSRFNPIEIPDDLNSRKRKHYSDGGNGRYKLRCRTESHQSSQSPFVPWTVANLYL